MCLILALPFVVGAPLHAQEIVEAEAYRTVNVRSGPGTQYPVIAQLENGDIVRVTARNDEESNWLRIELETDIAQGWIAYFTVNITGNLNLLPIIQDISPTQSFAPSAPDDTITQTDLSPTSLVVTAFRAVNVRSAPNISSSRLGVLEPGERATITGKTVDDEWLRIDFNGREAWIAFFVVTVSGDIDSLPVIPAQELPQTQAATTELDVITRFNANMRATPNRNAELMAVIPYNTQLRATARSASGDWLRVDYEGVVGWLVSSLVSIDPSQDLEQLPVELS